MSTATEWLPRRQAAFVAASAATAGALAWGGVFADAPDVALGVTLGAGVGATTWRRLYALPLVAAAVGAVALLADAIEVPAVVLCGLVAGLVSPALLYEGASWLDHVESALATSAAAAFGLFAAVGLVGDVVSDAPAAIGVAAITGLVASQGLVPTALRRDRVSAPTAGEIRRNLPKAYRAPVERAVALFHGARRKGPGPATTRGLAEVATWVLRLQVTRSELDQELVAVDPVSVGARITACRAGDDPRTRDARAKTAQHLERLLAHREAMVDEVARTDALVESAIAFLEEASAGLAVGRSLPGERAPERLGDVLDQLRAHAAAGEARRRTHRELAAVG
jgi:hypothetical protein